MQFFDVDGNEIDVQDLRFFLEEEDLIKQKRYIEELLNVFN